MTKYEEIGGALGVETLVDDFYHIMSTDPKARECLATHSGRELKDSAEKLKLFLTGWLGGPQLYVEKHGHPRLRMRHFPFSISKVEADQWLYCMEKALSHSNIRRELQVELLSALAGVTQMLINQQK